MDNNLNTVTRALKFSLIFDGEEYTLEAPGRVTKVTTEGKESRRFSINNTIHQAFLRPNLKMNFKWSIVNFEYSQKMGELYNAYNASRKNLYLKRQKLSGESDIFEVHMSQPSITLTEINTTGDKWGSLEMEVISRKWQSLTF